MAQFEEAASAHVQKLNFPYGNSDCAVCQTVVTPENFPYSLLCQSLSIPDILYYELNIFPFQTSFDILYILGPYIRAC